MQLFVEASIPLELVHIKCQAHATKMWGLYHSSALMCKRFLTRFYITTDGMFALSDNFLNTFQTTTSSMSY
jgi:hypothetical protein